MINVGKKLVAHNIQGFIAGQAIFFLLNFNLAERQIWITRHGASFQLLSNGKVKARTTSSTSWEEVCVLEPLLLILDAHLTDKGRKYAKALAGFIDCMDALILF